MAKKKKDIQQNESIIESENLTNSQKELQAFFNKINSKKNIVKNTTDEIYLKREIPFGIYQMDSTVGYLQCGKVFKIWGIPNGGKTTTCAYISAQANRTCRYCYSRITETNKCKCGKAICMRVLYADSENKIDIEWFKKIGIKEDSFFLIDTSSGSEHSMNSLLESVQSGLFDLFIIDSWAHLTPSGELDSEMENLHPGLHARLGNKFLRVWNTKVQNQQNNGIFPTLVIVNQVREDIKAKFNKDVATGGKGQNFSAYLSFFSHWKQEEKETGSKELLSEKIHIIVDKAKTKIKSNKICYTMYKQEVLSSRSLNYQYGDINFPEDMFVDAIMNNLIIQDKSGYRFNEELLNSNCLFDNSHILDIINKTYKSQKEIKETLKNNNSDFVYLIRTELKNRVLSNSIKIDEELIKIGEVNEQQEQEQEEVSETGETTL